MAAATRIASATSVPATKRAEVRCPKRERSATPRSHGLSDNAMKIVLNTAPSARRTGFSRIKTARDGHYKGRAFKGWSLALTLRAVQYFLSQTGGGLCGKQNLAAGPDHPNAE